MDADNGVTPSHEWPEGDAVETPCPYCGHKNTQDISIVRAMGGEARDADCDSCGRDYHIEANAKAVTSHKLQDITTPVGFKAYQAI